MASLRYCAPLMILVLIVGSVPARAGSNSPAAAILQQSQTSSIEGVSWNAASWPVLARKVGLDEQPVVRIEGKLRKPGWQLSYSNREIARSPVEGREPIPFLIEVVLMGPVTSFELIASGPNGEKVSESRDLNFDDFSAYLHEIQYKPSKRAYFFSSVGPTYLNYSEAGQSDRSGFTVTAKVSSQFLLLPPRWDLGFSAYVNLTPISQDGVSMRFFGASLRLGYVVPFVQLPWHLSLMAGWYYSTMLVTPRTLGYRNMVWPQLFPVLSRAMKGGSVITARFKFAPMMDRFSFLPLSNREIGLELGWTHPLRNGHPLSLSADLSWMDLRAKNLDLSSSSYSVLVGYGW